MSKKTQDQLVCELQERIAELEDIANQYREAASDNDLRLSEQRYRQLVEASPDLIYITDSLYRIRYVNQKIADLFDTRAEKMQGKTWQEFLPPESYLFYRGKFSSVFRSGLSARFETSTAILGEYSWEDTRLVPLKHQETGEVQAILGITRDITERKELEMAVVLAGRSVQMGIYIRQEGRIAYANLFLSRCLGYSIEELESMSMMNIVHPDYREKVRECSKLMMRAKLHEPYEYKIIAKSGDPRWVSETVIPFFFRGRPAVLGNIVDITRQKEMECALIRIARGRGENILLVHEDEVNGEIIKEILQAFGYCVLLVTSGFEAIKKLEGTISGIDLVIIDSIRAPQDTVEKIRSQNPDLKMILVGGAGNGGGITALPNMSNIEFLAARIRLALDSGKAH